MAVNTLIQNVVIFTGNPLLTRDSAGNLYVVYSLNTDDILRCAYSTDAGNTWNEISSGIDIRSGKVSCAIDSQDNLHVTYIKSSDTKVYYNTFSGFAWGSPEVVSPNTAETGATVTRPAIAVDSADIPHIIWIRASDDSGYYSSRATGSWSAELIIASGIYAAADIVIDSNDHLHTFFGSTTAGGVYYARYTSFWTATVQVMSTATFQCQSIAVDNSNNIHVVGVATSGTNVIQYVKYTKSTDSWGVQEIIVTDSSADHAFIGVDSDDNLNVTYESNDIKLIQNTGSWGSPTTIIAIGAETLDYPALQTTIYPIVDAVNVNIPSVGYMFTFLSNGNLRFYSSTGVTYPSPEGKNYSRKAANALPSTDANLDNLFTTSEYADVAEVDNDFATQSATDQYSIFEFKNKGNSSSDNIVVTWVGQSNIAPSTSPVYLQIYNRNSSTWETLDSDSTSAAGGNFSLSGTKTSSLSNYYDGSNWVSCRVYQLAA